MAWRRVAERGGASASRGVLVASRRVASAGVAWRRVASASAWRASSRGVASRGVACAWLVTSAHRRRVWRWFSVGVVVGRRRWSLVA
ncbi:hypothetical protein ACXZ9C_11855 [Streptococcus agalactiae]